MQWAIIQLSINGINGSINGEVIEVNDVLMNQCNEVVYIPLALADL